jgi:hypothetical protein
MEHVKNIMLRVILIFTGVVPLSGARMQDRLRPWILVPPFHNYNPYFTMEMCVNCEANIFNGNRLIDGNIE